MKLVYLNQEADRFDVRIAAVNAGRPLRYGGSYNVDDTIAEALLCSGHWKRIDGGNESVTVALPWLELTKLPGIGAELAQALYIGLGIATRADLRREVERYGIERLIQVPGVGRRRARDLERWAKEEA